MKRKFKNIAPAEVFKRYNPKRVKLLEPHIEALLFWPCKERKWINDEGAIRFSIGDDDYVYQITSEEILWTRKNSSVTLCYNPDHPKKVYVFETLNEDYLGEIEPRMELNKENKKEVLALQRQLRKKMTAYARAAKKRDENVAEGLPADYNATIPDLEAEIVKRDLKELAKKHKQKTVSP